MMRSAGKGNAGIEDNADIEVNGRQTKGDHVTEEDAFQGVTKEYEAFRQAMAHIQELKELQHFLTDDRYIDNSTPDKMKHNDHVDRVQSTLRSLLICRGNNDSAFDLDPAYDLPLAEAKCIYADLDVIFSYPYGGRDYATRLAIEDSLCPVHFCDWLACFDDQDEGCAQVRAIYPCSHDT